MIEGTAGGAGDISPTTVFVVMIVLAGLDLTGSILAKQWTVGGGSWVLLAGAAAFLLLFGVYALSLRYAEMSTITLGWIVALQVGVMAVERVRYGVTLSPGKWIAVAVIIAAQAYLVLAPSSSAERVGGSAPPADTPTAGSRAPHSTRA